VIRRPVRLHFDLDGAERGLERDGLAHFVERGCEERLHLLLLDGHLEDADGCFRQAVGADRRLGDALHHVDPLGDPSEGGELAVERGLRKQAHEELRAIAIGLIGNSYSGNHAALVLQAAGFAGQQVETARAPEIARRLGILEQRIAALNDAVGYHAKESAAVVIPLAGQGEELQHVFGRPVGGEFEAERAEIGGHHRLQILRRRGGLAPREAGAGAAEQSREDAFSTYGNASRRS
jgi:hypothetical protein